MVNENKMAKFGDSEVRSAPTSDDPSDSYHQSSKSKTCTCCCCRQIGTMYHPFSPACRTIPLESFVVSTRSDLLLLAANSRDKWYRACSMKSEPQHRCTILVHICLQLSGNVELNSGQPRGSKSLWQSVNPGLVPQYLTPKSFFLVTPSTAQITRVLVEVLLSMLLTIHPCLHCPVVLPVVR